MTRRLTFGQAARGHRCYTVSGDTKCFVCGRFLCALPPLTDNERSPAMTPSNGPSSLVEPWPAPYLQPDRTKDCGYYSVAYIGQCFGLDVTADDVKGWRAETNRHEDRYLHEVHGLPMCRPEHDRRAGRPYQQWWMGPDLREWVAEVLDAAVCLVHLLRIPTMHHSVVALEAREDGVLLMDPIYGHVVEPWDWFLGPGPGTPNAHALWSAHPLDRSPTWAPAPPQRNHYAPEADRG